MRSRVQYQCVGVSPSFNFRVDYSALEKREILHPTEISRYTVLGFFKNAIAVIFDRAPFLALAYTILVIGLTSPVDSDGFSHA